VHSVAKFGEYVNDCIFVCAKISLFGNKWELKMKPLLFLAADYASVTGDGKLNVMGIFNDINAFNFPARHSSMHLIAKLGPELAVKLIDQLLELKKEDKHG
jgi:hypothetical protein